MSINMFGDCPANIPPYSMFPLHAERLPYLESLHHAHQQSSRRRLPETQRLDQDTEGEGEEARAHLVSWRKIEVAPIPEPHLYTT